MTRKLLLFAVLVAASVLAFWWAYPRPFTIDHALANRITKGLTEEEVLAIIQAPPGDYTTTIAADDNAPQTAYQLQVMHRRFWLNHEPRIDRTDLGWIALNWITDGGQLLVYFDARDMTVVTAQFQAFPPEPASEKCRRLRSVLMFALGLTP